MSHTNHVTQLEPDRPASGLDERIGPYRLVRELGRGGMGVVYLAVRDDDAFQKRVAVKILKRGVDTDAVVTRFRNERQILAGLDHPNIARLIDGGSTGDGRPYFVMEYVDGATLVEYSAAHHLDTTARLDLFQQVCAAVQYAHQNLIIHRDIKPANVLVTRDGIPKLLDFGIAKLLNPELAGHTLAPTALGLALMTPEYASPEQVRGDPVTTATDIYSLGVLLYELLTERRPYELGNRSPSDIAAVICETAPPRPSTAVTEAPNPRASAAASSAAARPRTGDAERLRRRLEGDLDTIVLKALSKEPPRRYASVDQFAEDVRRHLAGLPVIARKDTLGYRTAKFVRRNRAAVAAAAGVVVALVAGIIGTTWQAREAGRERARAEQRFEDVRALANDFLFELHDRIKDLPGSTPARQLVASRGMAYLDKLSQDAGDRADLRRDLAAGYLRLGDVQGRPLNPNLGDTAGALASYRKSVSLYESLASSTDPALRREMAMAYLRLSELLASSGQTSEALTVARKGLEVMGDVPADVNVSPAAVRDLVSSYSRVGDLLSATGATREALDYRRRSLALMEQLIAVAPTDPDNVRQLGVAYHKLANSLGNPNYPNVGDHEGALAPAEKSIEVFRRASAEHPENFMLRRNLAVAISNAGDILTALKRMDEALARQQESMAIFEAQAKEDPTNVAALNDLAIGYFKIGEMLDGRGRSLDALAQYEQALAIHQRLSARDPGNASMKLEVATDRSAIGVAQSKLGRRTESLSNHSQAVETSRALSAANTGNVELRIAVALALIGRADAAELLSRGAASTRAADRDRALADYREALAIYEKLKGEGVIEGTDLSTMNETRDKLDRLAAASVP